MYAVPDVDEVVAVAKELGIHLSPEEAVLYRKYLLEQLSQFDAFVQARLEEPRPPMVSAARKPGYRPTPEEDPLNAWTWKCRIEGATGGALAGKTVSYKDHIAVAGMPMSFGSFALEGFIPDFDATVVTRVLEAGGSIIGKNVMNGLSGGFGTGGSIGDYGRPLNPHNHEHVTGGSSSGSGAAVAAGEVDISFGGDQGGSIRIPAAFCGIIGHKPTFGLVSHFGIGFGSDQSIDYTGPMARTVEDTAAALQATAGYDPYDPRQTRDVPTRIDVLGRLADGVARLRIGVLQEGFDDAEGDVRDLVLAAVDVLGRAGDDHLHHAGAQEPQARKLPGGRRGQPDGDESGRLPQHSAVQLHGTPRAGSPGGQVVGGSPGQHAARRAFLRRSAPHAGRLRLPARDRLEQDHRRPRLTRGKTGREGSLAPGAGQVLSQSGHELLDQRVDLVRNLGGREVPRAGEFHIT